MANPVLSWAEGGGRRNAGRHPRGPRSLELLTRMGGLRWLGCSAASAEANLGCFSIRHALLSPQAFVLASCWDLG